VSFYELTQDNYECFPWPNREAGSVYNRARLFFEKPIEEFGTTFLDKLGITPVSKHVEVELDTECEGWQEGCIEIQLMLRCSDDNCYTSSEAASGSLPTPDEIGETIRAINKTGEENAVA
jgi:hypothetical protein